MENASFKGNEPVIDPSSGSNHFLPPSMVASYYVYLLRSPQEIQYGADGLLQFKEDFKVNN